MVSLVENIIRDREREKQYMRDNVFRSYSDTVPRPDDMSDEAWEEFHQHDEERVRRADSESENRIYDLEDMEMSVENPNNSNSTGLPTPYVLNLESPTITFNGILYQLNKETDRDDNFIIINDTKYALDNIATSKELEDLYVEHNKETIERFKSKFLEDDMQTSYVSRQEIERRLNNNRTLKLILDEILPVITSVRLDNQIDAVLSDKEHHQSTDISDLLNKVHSSNRSSGNRRRTSSDQEVVRRAKDEIIRKINGEYRQYARPTESIRRTRIDSMMTDVLGIGNNEPVRVLDESIFNTELIGHNNFAIIENKLYTLTTIADFFRGFNSRLIDSTLGSRLRQTATTVDPTTIREDIRANHAAVNHSVRSRIQNKLESTRIKLNGNYYLPIFSEEKNGLVNDYKKLFEKKFKIEAVNHSDFQAETLKRLDEEKEQLEKLVNTNQFEVNGAGFMINGGKYYAYITTPEYVLRSPHNNNYYKFPKAKIGVSVDSNSGGFELGSPIVLNRYKHPFLDSTNSWQRICMGHYNTSRARRLPPGQAVLTLLTKARENLMLGYKTGSGPYHKLNDNYFSENKISEAQFKRSKLPCLNDYKNNAGRRGERR